MWFSNRSDKKQAAQAQKVEVGNFGFKKVEELYNPCSENKGADQLTVTAKLICAFVFAYAICWFSHGAACYSMFPYQENMSVKCIPPHAPLSYGRTGVCRSIPILLNFGTKHRLWVLGEAGLTCTHDLFCTIALKIFFSDEIFYFYI